jgi:hypothetical protein
LTFSTFKIFDASIEKAQNTRPRNRAQGMDTNDAKKLVASGYDQIVDAYLRRYAHSAVRERKLAELEHGLPLKPACSISDAARGCRLHAK